MQKWCYYINIASLYFSVKKQLFLIGCKFGPYDLNKVKI